MGGNGQVHTCTLHSSRRRKERDRGRERRRGERTNVEETSSFPFLSIPHESNGAMQLSIAHLPALSQTRGYTHPGNKKTSQPCFRGCSYDHGQGKRRVVLAHCRHRTCQLPTQPMDQEEVISTAEQRWDGIRKDTCFSCMHSAVQQSLI